MRAVVVYESMYGNTRKIAEAIAAGIGPQAICVQVGKLAPDLVASADLLVVGGPTHAWGMSRSATREAAVRDARKPGSALTLEPGAEGAGLREWFASLGDLRCRAVAFDTRVKVPTPMFGRASGEIAKRLNKHGAALAARPHSFFVTRSNTLHSGEEERARAWGAQLSGAVRVSG